MKKNIYIYVRDPISEVYDIVHSKISPFVWIEIIRSLIFLFNQANKQTKQEIKKDLILNKLKKTLNTLIQINLN